MKGETKMKPKQTKPLYLALTLLAVSMLAFSLIAPLCSGSSQKWKTFEDKEWGLIKGAKELAPLKHKIVIGGKCCTCFFSRK
jgi:hypothetical protein